MKDSAYKKTEYYLYNYTKIDEIIENIKEDIIAYANVSGSAWLRARGFKATSNTVENQAIKIADSKRIKDLKKVKTIIGQYLKIFKERNPKRYKFIKMKYFEKETSFNIEKELGYTNIQQIDITDTVVSFFYRQFKKAGIGGM